MNEPNYDQICEIVEQKLVPTFEMLGKMLKQIDDKASNADMLAQKIISSMSDAVMGQKQGMFQDLISSKFAPEIDPLDQFYSDTMGTKFSDQLIRELMDSDVENPEEFITNKIGESKSKYGKYLGISAPVPETEEAPGEPAPEAAPEEPEGEPAGLAVEVKEKSKKPRAEDMAKLLGLSMNEK
jgi:hypothetical protein